jgi:hypothetical protein
MSDDLERAVEDIERKLREGWTFLATDDRNLAARLAREGKPHRTVVVTGTVRTLVAERSRAAASTATEGGSR